MARASIIKENGLTIFYLQPGIELKDAEKFFVAARAGFDNVRNDPNLISTKLPALHFYQLAIPAPKPPADSFNRNAALHGKEVLEKKAKCATCHVPLDFYRAGLEYAYRGRNRH